MSYIFIFFLVIELLILGFFKGVSYSYNLGLILTIINIISSLLFLITNKRKFKLQLIVGYIIRCLVMYFDIIGRDIFILPVSGGDTEGFYLAGLSYSSGTKILGGKLYGELYSKVIGLIFRFVGDQRVFAQYINVVLSVITIIILINILNDLNINQRIKNNIVWIISLLPMNILISSVLLRESIIIFLSTLSIYFYINYIKNGHYSVLLISIFLLLMSSMFHSGMIVLLSGIIFNEVLIKSNKYSIFKKIFLIVITVILLLLFKNIIFDKFIYQKKLLDNYDTYVTEAGSRYLPNVYINNIKLAFKFGWLKALYFVASPTPLYWRGISDIITFFTDSIIYLYIITKILLNGNISKYNKNLYKSLLLSLVIALFTFGIGTSSAGTAMRHRNKLIILFLIIYGISENYKLSNKIKIKINI